MSNRIRSSQLQRRPATTGRILVKLHECHCAAPAHFDVLNGSARPLNTIDGGGPLDRRVRARTSAMRVRRVFAAREMMHRPGEMGTGYANDERELGIDRIVALELADPDVAADLCRDLSAQHEVEWAMAEPLASAPLGAPPTSQTLTMPPSPTAIRRPHERVRAFEALATEPGDNAILIAAVDTGIALEHEEFSGRIYGGLDTVDLGMGQIGGGVELVGDSRGRDFCARDETGHGTHVAGIMSAVGIRVPQGLAGAASLAPIRALAAARAPDGQVVGIGGTLDIDAALKAAADMGVRVMNLSFGTSENEMTGEAPPVHADSIAYVMNRGVICVAAMGNSGREERFYPAALPGVIAVGSIGEYGHASEFSSTGDHIALSAPGEDVISVGLEGYRSSTGTSHAAPFVSGAVALMLAHAERHGESLTAAECRQILTETARPGHAEALANEIGAGELDVSAALERTRTYFSERKEAKHD